MPDQGWHLQQIIGAYVLQITKLQAELDALKEQVQTVPQPAPNRKKS